MAKIVIQQNSYSAALLVAVTTLLIWFVFNMIVPAYPPHIGRTVTAQQTASTQTIVNP